MSFRDHFRQSLTAAQLAAELSGGAPGSPAGMANRARRVVELAGSTRAAAAGGDIVLREVLRHAWSRGWQPVDVWQVCRRELTDDAADLVLGASAADTAEYAQASVHPRWWAQLGELGAHVWWSGDEPYCAAWARRAERELADVLAVVINIRFRLLGLPPEPMLIPPPGEFIGPADSARSAGSAGSAGTSAGSAGSPGSGAEVDPKMLARVRALLAKAESTSFPEEADAFFAKAQELMSRYSLERALLEATEHGGVSSVRAEGRRVWLDTPYLSPKFMLVSAVAKANRCRAVFREHPGFVTVMGEETDIELVEVLTTSLLVQASRAMLATGSQTDWGGTSRTRSFRRSFLVSYAQRISERLDDASRRAQAQVADSVGDGRLLPVLAAKEAAVAAFVASAFPTLTTRRVSVSNSAGWVAGRAAADLANLNPHKTLH